MKYDFNSNWMRLLFTGAAVVFVLLLTACSSSEPLRSHQELTAVSAVSVSQPGFVFRPGESVAWRTELLWLGDDSQQQYRQKLRNIDIKQEIEAQLQHSGLRFVSPAKADYVLIAAFVIGDSAEGSALEELSHLYPALGPVVAMLEKGSLLMALGRPGSPVTLWRGSVLTDFSAAMSDQQRTIYLQSVVHSLLVTLPESSVEVK